MNFTINPLIGVGDVGFGMTTVQVASLIGTPDDSEIEEDSNEMREYRRKSGIQAVYSKGERELVELGFGRNIEEVSYFGVPLFTADDKDVYDRLCADDNNPFLLYGFIVFVEIGVTLSGFFKSDDYDKAVTVFKKADGTQRKWQCKNSASRIIVATKNVRQLKTTDTSEVNFLIIFALDQTEKR